MRMTHAKGNKMGKVVLYALSTCGWCRKTKRLLDKMGIEYSYVDVDLLEDKEEDEVMKEIERWNPKCSFPTVVVNNEKCIVGFNEEKIKKAVGYE
ncbi:glutaredoxin family protein [candidate division TA06 bacterium]|uniref:Glutaredoxin family protein n=1 Tax=candidate division TA06 bacterium TaxID=2250710 RepID=A0A523UW55_UNCT6|nr:MAG: glutaredoxin family protein [candidate division TA06 bacterium]